jgi:hypothetical protein
MAAPMLISDDYLKQNQLLHESEPTYGTSSWQYAPVVIDLCERFRTLDILDYGCGKGRLQENLPFPIKQYDPAIPEFAALPHRADLVVCGDVMEHIEPDCVDEVLEHIMSLTKKAGYWIIATKLAAKSLPDGRNCHLIVEPAAWWEARLISAGFAIAEKRTGRKREAIFATTPPAL